MYAYVKKTVITKVELCPVCKRVLDDPIYLTFTHPNFGVPVHRRYKVCWECAAGMEFEFEKTLEPDYSKVHGVTNREMKELLKK